MHVLGGLMALGYEIGTIMKRSSTLHSDDTLTIKTDDIEGMDQAFTQVPKVALRPACTPAKFEDAQARRSNGAAPNLLMPLSLSIASLCRLKSMFP